MQQPLSYMEYSIHALNANIVLKLKALYSEEEARAISDRLFEYYFDLSPVQRVLSGKAIASSSKILLIDDAVNKLLTHIPLQYVTGKAFFMELEFDVNSSVLIPRPETEELVSLLIKDFASNHKSNTLNILDIGTGSGCIAISLKRYLPESKVTAVDVSRSALKVAALNALKNKASVDFLQADIREPKHWGKLPECDLIVSNPPYVTLSEKKLMLPNVLEHEPHIALFVSDDDPLVFYRHILEFSKTKLRKDGSVWFEINEKFGEELKDIALNQGFKNVNIIFDFRGKSRFLHCSKLNSRNHQHL